MSFPNKGNDPVDRWNEGLERRILEKQPPQILSLLVLFGLLIFLGGMGGETARAQGQVKERIRGRINPSAEERVEGSHRRDPFLLPPGVSLLSKREANEKPAPSQTKPLIMPVSAPLRVKAILISDTIRLAAIDQYIVGIGDLIKDERVLEIETDRVILGKGTDQRTLLLSQSGIPLRVEGK